MMKATRSFYTYDGDGNKLSFRAKIDDVPPDVVKECNCIEKGLVAKPKEKKKPE